MYPANALLWKMEVASKKGCTENGNSKLVLHKNKQFLRAISIGRKRRLPFSIDPFHKQ